MDRDTALKILQKLTNLKNILNPVVILSKVLTRETPVIIHQPESVEAPENTSSYFIVEAENITAYQWQYKRKETGVNWTNASLTGNSTKKLQFTVIPSREAFWYRCKLTGVDESIIYTESVDMKVTGG